MTNQGIFQEIYNHFLAGNLEMIEKCCSDMALGYFKTLLKKREVDVRHKEFSDLLGCVS